MDSITTLAPIFSQGIGAVGGAIASSRAATQNTRVGNIEAQQAILNSQFEAQQSQRRTAQVLAKQRAIAAASGVDSSSGTPMDVYLDSVRQGELERQTILSGGKIRANQARYGAYLASQRNRGEMVASLSKLSTIFANNRSTLSDLWKKATSGGSGGGTISYKQSAEDYYGLT